jgi:hypothetical protein
MRAQRTLPVHASRSGNRARAVSPDRKPLAPETPTALLALEHSAEETGGISAQQTALTQAYWAMGLQLFHAHVQLGNRMLQASFSPLSMIAPMQRAAVANAGWLSATT